MSFSISSRANAPQPPFGDLRTSKRLVVNSTAGFVRIGEEGGVTESTDDEHEEVEEEEEEKVEEKEELREGIGDRPSPTGEIGGEGDEVERFGS